MIHNRHAIVDRVPQGIRGGHPGLYQSVGRAQVGPSGPCARSIRTNRRERQHRGSWKGELGLRLKAVLFVRRQLVTIKSLVNERTLNEKKRSCPTQRVGATAEKLLEKSSST